jgi:hypothetical protein
MYSTIESGQVVWITKANVLEARSWIADCEWGDDTDDLTDIEVINGIKRHYCGGWTQFLRDA